MKKLLVIALAILMAGAAQAEWPSITTGFGFTNVPYDSTNNSVTAESIFGTSVVATPKTVTITGATNATPIVVTATAHGLKTGDRISISGITGNTNANGYFQILKLTDDTFALRNYSTGADIAGNGAYGGAPVAVTGIVQAQRVLVGDGTTLQPAVAFANYPGTGISTTSGAYLNSNVGGVAVARVSVLGLDLLSNGIPIRFGSSSDTIVSWGAAATLQLGAAAANADGVDQTIQTQGGITGTDRAAGDLTIQTGLGTGAGASKVVVRTPTVLGSGTTGQTQATRATFDTNGMAVNVGTGTATARVGGVLNVNTTSQATTGTSEEVLATYTMPANTLARDGQAIRFYAWGITAANANSKTVRVRFGGIGGLTVVINTVTANNASWYMSGYIVRTGAATQDSFAQSMLASPANNVFAQHTQTLSNAVDFVVTATTATAAGDVTFKGLVVEALN